MVLYLKTPRFNMSDSPSHPRRHHRDTAGKIIKIAVPLAISAVLIAWLFHKIDMARVEQIIRQGVKWQYIGAMMVITVLSHIIRGIRWGIQLRAAGIPRIPAVAESVSIFGAYALNLIFPYLGEAWRCVYISKREGVKLSTVVGTDIGDRASDGIMILLFVVATSFVARPALDHFFRKYPIGESVEHFFTHGAVWIWGLGILALLAVVDYAFRHTPTVQGINASMLRMWRGFAVLFHMKGTGLYLILTLGIWTCYFFETYVCFFAFPFTRELVFDSTYLLGIVPGLVVFVFGSCSMAVPSNGGLGPWNLAVMFALTLYGVGANDAAAYALVCWSFQALIQMLTGIFGAFYIMWDRHRRPHSKGARQ